jgi:hypothetical protein
MKHELLFVLVALGLFTRGQSETLGHEIDLTPPAGWQRARPFPSSLAESPYPTLKYLPCDGRNAEIIITLLPPDAAGFRVSDPKSLKRFSLLAAGPYLGEAAPSHVAEFTLRDGLAIAVTAPVSAAAPEPRRLATVAGLFIASKHLVHVAIIHEADMAPEFLQALETMLSVRFRSASVAQTGR